MGWMLVRERKLLRDAPRRFEWRFCEDSMTIGAAFLHGWADRYARQRGLDALEVSVSQITRIIVFPGGQRGVPMVPDCYELSLKLPYRLDRPRWDTLQSSSTLLIRRQAFYGREREIIEAFERYGIPVELRGSLR